MARRPLNERLQTAANLLREASARLDDPKFADAAPDVEAILEPGAWTKLRSAVGSGKETFPLTLDVSPEVKEALQAAAEDMTVTLSAAAEGGYQRVLDSDWLPPRRVPALAGSKSGRTVINLSVSKALHDQVQERLAEFSERAGYRVYESTIALYGMADELGVDLAPVEVLELFARRPLRDHTDAVLKERGSSYAAEILAGVEAVEAGSWTPPKPSWAGYGKSLQRINVRVSEDLLSRLEEHAARLTSDLGYTLKPTTLAIEILRSRLGEPAE